MTDVGKETSFPESTRDGPSGDNRITPSEITEIVEGIVQSAVKTAISEDSANTKRKNIWRQRPKGQSGATPLSDSLPSPPSPHLSSLPSILTSPSLSSSPSSSSSSSSSSPSSISSSFSSFSSSSSSEAAKALDDRSNSSKKRRKITYSRRQLIALSNSPACLRPPKSMLADCQRREPSGTTSTPVDDNQRYRRRSSLTNEPHRVGGRKWAETTKKDDGEGGTETTTKVTSRTKGDRYSSWRDREAEEAEREGRRRGDSNRDRDGRARPYGNRRNDGGDENTPEWFTADAKSDFDLGGTVLDREADRNLLERIAQTSKSDKKESGVESEKKTEEKHSLKPKTEVSDQPKLKTEQPEKDTSLPKALENLSLTKESTTKVEMEKVSGASDEDRAALGRWFNLDQFQHLAQGGAPFGASSSASSSSLSSSPSRWKYTQEDYEAFLTGSRSSSLTALSNTRPTETATTPSVKGENVLSPLFAAMASPPTTGHAQRSFSSKWGFDLEDDDSSKSSQPPLMGDEQRSNILPPPLGVTHTSPRLTSFKNSKEETHSEARVQSGTSHPTAPGARVLATDSSPSPAPILQRTPLENLSTGTPGTGTPQGSIFTRVPPSPITTLADGVSKSFPFPPPKPSTPGVAATPPTNSPAGMGSFTQKISTTGASPPLPRQGSGSPLTRASPSQGGQREKDDGQRLFRINVEDLFKTLQHQALPPLPSMPAAQAASAARLQQQQSSPGLGSPGLGSPGLGSPLSRGFHRQESPGVGSPGLTGGSFGSFSQPSQHRPTRDQFPSNFDYDAEQLKQLHTQHSQFPTFKPRSEIEFQSHRLPQSPQRPDSEFQPRFDRSGSLQKVTPTTPTTGEPDKSGKPHPDAAPFQPKSLEGSSRRGFEYRPPRSFENRSSTGGSGGPGFSPGFFPPAFPLHFPHSSQQHPYQHAPHGGFPYRKPHEGSRHGDSDHRAGGLSGGTEFRGSGTGLSINLPPTAPLGSLSSLGARASPTVKDPSHGDPHDSDKWGRHASLVANHHRQQQQQPQIQLHHQMHLPPMMPMNLPLSGKGMRRSTSHDSLNIAHYPIPKFQGPSSYSALPLTSQTAPRIPVSGSGSGVNFPTNPPVTIPTQLAAQFKKP